MKNNSKIRLQLFTWFAMIAFSHTVSAQEAMSLQACVDQALEQSLQLKADGYDLDKSKARVKQAFGALLPTVTSISTYDYQFEMGTTVLPAEAFGGVPGTYNAVEFGVPQTQTSVTQLEQKVFNKPALLTLKASRAKIGLDQLQIRSSKEELVYNVSATYFNIQSLEKQIELASETLKSTEALLAISEAQLRSGLTTQTDVDRLTVSRDNSKAGIESLENSLEKYYNLLKTLMTVPLSDEVRVYPFEVDAIDATAFGSPTVNPAQRTDYLRIVETIKLTEIERKSIKAGYLPTMSLTAKYGWSSFNDNADPFERINDAFYSNSSVGFKVKVTVFDGFAIKNQAKQKQFEIEKYKVQGELAIQNIQREVADAHADLKSNFNTFQSQARNLTLAQKVMNDIDKQYKNGIAKLSDVLNSKTELQTAQTAYVQSAINIRQAELNLKKAQGKLIN